MWFKNLFNKIFGRTNKTNTTQEVSKDILVKAIKNTKVNKKQAKELFKLSLQIDTNKTKTDNQIKRERKKLEKIVGKEKLMQIEQKTNRSKLYKQFNYQKQRARKAWERLRYSAEDAYAKTGSNFVAIRPAFLDYNVRNKLFDMTDKEIEELIQEVKEFADTNKTDKKALYNFWFNAVVQLFESERIKRISYEQLERELDNIFKEAGFTKKQWNNLLDKVNTVVNSSPFDLENFYK